MPAIDPAFIARTQATIKATSPQLSQSRITGITSMLASIATDRIKRPDDRDYWVAMIGVESGYDGRAKSNKGAVGLGQLIPSYRADFGADCGMTDVTVADLSDDYTNLTLSACYFQTLLTVNKGNVPLALVSYNAGLYSKGLAKAKKGGSPGEEPAAYVAKVVIRKTNTEGSK